MENRTITFLCLIFLVSLNLSFRWPLENYRITSTFGESRSDHFHDGMDVISGNNNVYPVDDGELVFFWDKSIFPTENYTGGGNYSVLKHKDGIYSLYMHLEDASHLKNHYTVNDSLGKIGNTGRSYGKHLHFSLLKLHERKSINPVMLLPQFKDAKKPLVTNISVRIGEKYYPIKNNCKIRLTQHYPLHIKIIDLIRGQERLGVYRLKVILNSRNVIDAKFSEIGFSRNGLTISNKIFQSLYDENGYYKAENVLYNNGLNRIIVIALDYSGNKTIKEVFFNVKLEIE